MIKQQLLQISSADSFFNDHTSLYSFHSIHPFVPLYKGEFQISYQNRLVIKNLALGSNFIRFGEDKFINLKNVCMQKIIHPKTGLFGIKLSKNGVDLDIFGLSDQWIEIMKKYTIQFDFIQKYQLLNKLGEGYSTIVYRARNKLTKYEYAVKVFDKKRLLINKFEAKKFLKELKIIRCLDNQNLLKIYEVYESNNHIYLILELFKGEKLATITEKQQALSEQEILIIMKPLFQAVSYLHDLNIFHKQISTQSIIFKNKNDFSNPCLIDFNQAVQINEGDQKDEQTIPLNPEKQILYYIKFDVLSLGIVMHNLLTGKQFQVNQVIDDAMMNKFRGAEDLQFIDPPLSDLCFDFLNSIFYQGLKTKTCKQLLAHPIFDQENQKTQRNLGIQLIGILNQNSSRFRINSKQSQRSPKTIKVISLKKDFNIFSKSPSEKPPNLNNDYFEPPQSHLMFRRGSRQKRTLNFNNHNEISS
ncbi:unnamed protein product (macronuclear) [Paramecium tetraurelia]|uniref:Protein kinase domain-containing protein n=1 Tax=Paramecium tetraurelia TaxID=5888 RepID=A0CEY9_PARTE|nr:uncharacterized protein GSPATT00037795001 [Paramecium tetraurelia]CAK69356.1 unnamed protein product [Paramecium tetraurelia]|eukprot:XP_001436753.1 hypothetical protein (macronuclear) [Paramecium tetraurelia strain d4-2]